GNGLYYMRVLYDNNGVLLDRRIDLVTLNENGGCADTSFYYFSILHEASITDMQFADPWPPQSAVRALAPYTRLPAVILSMHGEDVGRSGILYYDVEFRRAEETTWRQLAGSQPEIAVFYPDASGWLAVRTRATDLATNAEPWSAAEFGDVQTTLYRSQFSGHYTDQRGNPLAEQPIAIAPFALEQGQSNPDGSYVVHTRGFNFTVNETMYLTTDADWGRNLYHQPAGSLLANGNFEGALQGNWLAAGNPLPQRTAKAPYNGVQSIRFGPACVGICTPNQYPENIPNCMPDVMPGCIAADAPYPPNWALETVKLIVGPDDTLHFVGRSYTGIAVYHQRQPDGTWQNPVAMGDTPEWWSTLEGAVGPNRDLHLLWDTREGDLFYRRRTGDGTWQAKQALGRGMVPKIAIDQSGVVHMLYAGDNPFPSEKQTLLYRQRSTGGVWSAPLELERYPYYYTSLSGLFYDIAADNGNVHIAWGEPIGREWAQAFQLVHRTRTGNGTWQPKQMIDQSASNFDDVHLMATGDLLNVLWRKDGSGFHATRPAAQSWSTPEMIGPYSFVTADRAGTLYAALAATGGQEGYYRAKRPTSGWSDRIFYDRLTYYQVQQLDVEAGAAGKLYTLWDLQVGPIYQTAQPATEATTGTLSQSITIPAAMHEPTLSFVYQFAGATAGESALAVTISAGLTTTTVFTATANMPWTLGWAALAQWQGETVTVTFALRQAGGEAPVRVDLDEITLTSWQTAVPQAVAPDQITPGVATTVIITGENFMATAQVRLGETLLLGMERLDAQHLRVTIPATIPPGRYPLWVQNSSAAPRAYAGQLQVGQPFYLPIIRR
ncbi:MAG: hypothetical protein KDE19_20915, partial [Caldilineaceae bacterium]|nr:hypothetical protein [Caldilineaceae bacterium]